MESGRGGPGFEWFFHQGIGCSTVQTQAITESFLPFAPDHAEQDRLAAEDVLAQKLGIQEIPGFGSADKLDQSAQCFHPRPACVRLSVALQDLSYVAADGLEADTWVYSADWRKPGYLVLAPAFRH